MLNLTDIQSTRARLQPYIVRTPLKRSRTLSDMLGTNVHIKMELFQKTGSFKPRGAFAQLLAMEEQARTKGVVAFSGGNFAQGVAYAAHILEMDAVIIMPSYTPQNYLDATRGYGAQVELAEDMPAVVARTEELAAEGRVKVHPFDHPEMVAGSAAIGMEVLEDLPEVTDIFVSIGGGGLVSGVMTAVQALKPGVRVWGVETEGAAAMSDALQAGKVVPYSPTSLARTLGAPFVSETALALCQQHLQDLVLVTDEEAYRALRFILERLKQLTELSAACTWAAALKRADQFTPESHVCLVLCGGNVSYEDLLEYSRLFDARGKGGT